MVATVTFPGLEFNDGCAVTHVRGVYPSAFNIYVDPKLNFPRTVGDLVLNDGDGTVITFKNCCCPGWRITLDEWRHAYRWKAVVYDRRWKWRYKRASGRYNVYSCDGSIQPSTKKTAQELIEKLLKNVLGESTAVISNIPQVYPHVDWSDARADLELECLLEKLGCVIWLGNDDVVRVDQLGVGAIPSVVDARDANFQLLPSLMPSKLQLAYEPSVFQDAIPLRSLGLETDGSLKPIGNLSYMPAGGWGHEWPWDFAGVAPEYRHLAIASVHRWFGCVPFAVENCPVPITSCSQIVPLGKLAESIADDEGVLRCPDAVIKGTFWAYADLPVNVVNGTSTMPFTIDQHLGVIKTEGPMIKFNGSVCEEPDLWLISAFHVIDPDTGAFVRHSTDQSVPLAETVTDPRQVRKTGMFYRATNVPVFTSIGTNQAAIEAEGGLYLTNIQPQYAFTGTIDQEMGGVQDVSLSGVTAQIQWRVGDGYPAATRIGVNHEFDVFTPSHHERRRQARLAQIAERFGVV